MYMAYLLKVFVLKFHVDKINNFCVNKIHTSCAEKVAKKISPKFEAFQNPFLS